MNTNRIIYLIGQLAKLQVQESAMIDELMILVSKLNDLNTEIKKSLVLGSVNEN